MKSKASIKSHPIHPILVSFPVAFFTAAFIADAVSFCVPAWNFTAIAFLLEGAGVMTALIAAIPGIIDFIYVIPPNSSAKKRGAMHGILNVTATCIFAMVFFLRMNSSPHALIVLLCELAGVVLVVIAGWMGGTLVYRNQIAVDHRYANAGRWKEKSVDISKVLDLHEVNRLQVDQMKLLHSGEKRIVTARTENGLVAFSDRCTHRGGPLSDGVMICGTVQCPWHGSQFDVHTGKVKAGPAKANIKTYSLTVDNKEKSVRIGE
ncbi:MAG TPA: DUF2231 domain-containing protein [Bacteroidia bacterium]|jgi:uncharacterized membrane protein/nitrite reductase/ring-hydroxylating ferredoxin subunit